MSGIRSVACAAAPSTDHVNGAWPCSSSQGEKWSEITAKSKPASSARRTSRTSCPGGACSPIIVYPNSAIRRACPPAHRVNRPRSTSEDLGDAVQREAGHAADDGAVDPDVLQVRAEQQL